MNPFGCEKECPQRTPGCHSACEKYKEAKEKYLEKQKKIKKERKKMNDLIEANKDGIKRCGKYKKR